VLGEPQILGQTKAAFHEAECSGCVGRDLHRWVPRAFAAAKQVRNETGICDAAVSVSYAAVQLARKIFESLSGKRVVLIGAGKTAELSAAHLREAGARSISVVNRTAAKAEELAARIAGVAAEFALRYEEISRSDVVICSTDAQSYVLEAAQLRDALRGRPRRPLLILDISVPRNADPAISSLEGAYLFNIDDLESVVQANRRGRLAEADRAEDLLRQALERFVHESSESLLGPEIVALRDRVRSICLGELERFEKKIPDLNPENRKDLELMLHRIAQKILHPAIMELKAVESRAGDVSRPDNVRKLFGLDRKVTTLS
jgi:glutamyl-tRNA reductase